MARFPSCFVVMPFGVRRDALGGAIDFEMIYRMLIRPALDLAGVSSARLESEDPDMLGMSSIERVVTADLAVFDMTTASPAVVYQLGTRHALRPSGSIIVAAQTASLPFDVAAMRVVVYELNASGRPENPEAFHRSLSRALLENAQGARVDSPVFTLWPQRAGLDAASFGSDAGSAGALAARSDLQAADALKGRIQQARRLGAEELREIEHELGPLNEAPADVLLALFDAYRATFAWQEMVELVGRMPEPVAAATRVQEQFALALNRLGRRTSAEAVLKALVGRGAASSETYSVLGRVYKDFWSEENRQGRGDDPAARGFLAEAIGAYLHAFEMDWRDPYPGMNAITLMAMNDLNDPRYAEILPVVSYAAKQHAAASRADYWDVATALELSVHADDEPGARKGLARLRSLASEPWLVQASLAQLKLLRECFARQQAARPWLDDIIGELEAMSAR